MIAGKTQTLQRDSGPDLHVLARSGAGPTILWLCGFRSDITGTKVQHLAAWAERTGRGFVAFDYTGHGRSGGTFTEGTITAWRDDALDVLDAVTQGDVVLVGSSMGGWIALLAALARPDRVTGIVLIAPAPDFTERLMWAGLDAEAKATIAEHGVWHRPSVYGDDPYPITRTLIEDGRNHLLLDAPVGIACPVRILHGQADEAVPWHLSLTLLEQLAAADARATFVKHGDHRLSTAADLRLLDATLEGLLQDLASGSSASMAANPSR